MPRASRSAFHFGVLCGEFTSEKKRSGRKIGKVAHGIAAGAGGDVDVVMFRLRHFLDIVLGSRGGIEMVRMIHCDYG